MVCWIISDDGAVRWQKESHMAESDAISGRGETAQSPENGDANQATAYGVRVDAANELDASATYWRCVDVHHLSADENRGRHCVFVRALDESGDRMSDPSLRIAWTWEGRTPGESAEPIRLDKPDGEIGHGLVDISPNQRIEVWLAGDELASDHVANLHIDHDVVENTSDGAEGNSRFHHSFLITFQRALVPVQPAAEEPTGEGVDAGEGEGGQTAPVEEDAARFLREEDSTPDGSVLSPGEEFDKIWVWRNTGNTAWTDSYRLAVSGGDAMGAESSQPIAATDPGAECRVTIRLTAPEEPGRQRSVWQLANADGRRFGDAVWTEIDVRAAGDRFTPDLGELPDIDQPIRVGPNAGPAQAAVANTWNRYGAVILEESQRLALAPAAAVAVLVTESRGEPFDAAGRMIVRFENHVFFQQWGAEHEEVFNRHFAFDPASPSTGHRWRPSDDGPMLPCHSSNEQEWAILDFARQLDDGAALRSISMGAAQIMGFNHRTVGYATPQAMFEDFRRDAQAQVRAMFRFMEINGLVDAVRGRDFERFANTYNGPLQPAFYAGLMRDYAAIFEGLLAAVSPEVVGEGAQESVGVTEPEGVAEPVPAWQRPRPKPSELASGHGDASLRYAWDVLVALGRAEWPYRALFVVGVVSLLVGALGEARKRIRARNEPAEDENR